MARKRDPFDEDDEAGSEQKANDAAKERMAERIEKREVKAEEPDEPVEVDLEKVDEDIDPGTLPAEARKSRREKRLERFSTLVERERLANERAEKAEQREREQRELFMQQLQRMQPSQQPQQPQSDPLADEWERTLQEQELLFREFRQRQNPSDEEQQAFSKKVREYQKKMVVLGGKMALKESGGGAPTEQQIRSAVLAERMQSEYGDVMGDERKRLYFQGVWQTLVAQGRQDDWSTLDDAAEATRKAYGMKTKKAPPGPSDAYKRKLSGMPRGGGLAGQAERQVVTLGKEQKRMANAAFAHIKDPEERYKRWAAGPGRRLLEKAG